MEIPVVLVMLHVLHALEGVLLSVFPARCPPTSSP